MLHRQEGTPVELTDEVDLHHVGVDDDFEVAPGSCRCAMAAIFAAGRAYGFSSQAVCIKSVPNDLQGVVQGGREVIQQGVKIFAQPFWAWLVFPNTIGLPYPWDGFVFFLGGMLAGVVSGFIKISDRNCSSCPFQFP